jgi:nickel/cobalt transporter (NiCoT) family protein
MSGLAALVFALGLRHGFDPDHLVAIDGLTRTSKSRWCGLFFSLGSSTPGPPSHSRCFSSLEC